MTLEKGRESNQYVEILKRTLSNIVHISTDLINIAFIFNDIESLAALGLANCLISATTFNIVDSKHFHRTLAILCLVFLPVALFLTFSEAFLTTLLLQDGEVASLT